MKGLASAFGLGDALKNVGEAAKKAASMSARCPNDGTLAKPGTKFCPECGAQMIQPALDACPKCGTPTGGAKFCPNCGTKIEQAARLRQVSQLRRRRAGRQVLPGVWHEDVGDRWTRIYTDFTDKSKPR